MLNAGRQQGGLILVSCGTVWCTVSGTRSQMAAHPYPRSRQGMAARPAAENLGGEFLFDVEGEMAEAEGPLRSVSLYVQPLTGKRRTVVCKHWLRGLCKKGDLCDYLHEYDDDKVRQPSLCALRYSLPSDVRKTDGDCACNNMHWAG
jgi:hypothetical protein